jgi:hypothetical protein
VKEHLYPRVIAMMVESEEIVYRRHGERRRSLLEHPGQKRRVAIMVRPAGIRAATARQGCVLPSNICEILGAIRRNP